MEENQKQPYDAEFHINQLHNSNNNVLQRLTRIETSLDRVFRAVTAVAKRTDVIRHPEVLTALEEADKALRA